MPRVYTDEYAARTIVVTTQHAGEGYVRKLRGLGVGVWVFALAARAGAARPVPRPVRRGGDHRGAFRGRLGAAQPGPERAPARLPLRSTRRRSSWRTSGRSRSWTACGPRRWRERSGSPTCGARLWARTRWCAAALSIPKGCRSMRLFLASGNAHKAGGVPVAGGRDVARAGRSSVRRRLGGMPPVAEDTGTFAGNARKKARALLEILPADSWVLADDSGLCVEALGGQPGVDSAYYAGPQGGSGGEPGQVGRGDARRARGAPRSRIRLRLGPRRARRLEARGFEGRCAGAPGARAARRGRLWLRPALCPAGARRRPWPRCPPPRRTG